MKHFVSFIFILFMFASCSSLDSDAKKAAELNKESLKYVKELDLQKAEKLYMEAQEIISEYKGTDKNEEFLQAYYKYLTEETKAN